MLKQIPTEMHCEKRAGPCTLSRKNFGVFGCFFIITVRTYSIQPRRASVSKSPFLQSVRTEIRTKQYSYRTKKSYLYWVRQFILFKDRKHPKVRVIQEIKLSLNNLAFIRGVIRATQIRPQSAFIFVT